MSLLRTVVELIAYGCTARDELTAVQKYFFAIEIESAAIVICLRQTQNPHLQQAWI